MRELYVTDNDSTRDACVKAAYALQNGAGGGGGAGDASAANQELQLAQETDAAASVASIDTKTPALGQALEAASTPVVLAAAQLVTLTPPAAIAGFATAANQTTSAATLSTIATNTTDGSVTAPVSVTSAVVLFTLDMAGYQSVLVQVTSAGTSCTITYETCNEIAGTYVEVNGSTSLTNAVLQSTSTAVGMRSFPITGRYFRARVSTYGSGTVTASACQRKGLPVGQVTAVLSGTSPTTAIGIAAHDAVIVGAPVRTGSRAMTANYTAVASGDVADAVCTAVGAQIVKPYSIPEADWSYAAPAGGKTATGGVTIVAAPAANIRNYITGIQIGNSGAAGTDVQIKDGAGGTVIWRGYVGATANSVGIRFDTPIRQPTTATLLELDISSGVTVAIYFDAQGYQAP